MNLISKNKQLFHVLLTIINFSFKTRKLQSLRLHLDERIWENDFKSIITNSFNLFEFKYFVDRFEIDTLISSYFLIQWNGFQIYHSNQIPQFKHNFKVK